jgi:hypothetical protein
MECDVHGGNNNFYYCKRDFIVEWKLCYIW